MISRASPVTPEEKKRYDRRLSLAKHYFKRGWHVNLAKRRYIEVCTLKENRKMSESLNLDELERRCRDAGDPLSNEPILLDVIALARKTEDHEQEMRKALALLHNALSVSYPDPDVAKAYNVLKAALAK